MVTETAANTQENSQAVYVSGSAVTAASEKKKFRRPGATMKVYQSERGRVLGPEQNAAPMMGLECAPQVPRANASPTAHLDHIMHEARPSMVGHMQGTFKIPPREPRTRPGPPGRCYRPVVQEVRRCHLGLQKISWCNKQQVRQRTFFSMMFLTFFGLQARYTFVHFRETVAVKQFEARLTEPASSSAKPHCIKNTYSASK